jgi:Beta-lactamase associated winged helix domain
VLAEVTRGKGTAAELTRRVYGPDLGDELVAAAEMTLRAHLKKLVDDGAVKVHTVKGEEVFESA